MDFLLKQGNPAGIYVSNFNDEDGVTKGLGP